MFFLFRLTAQPSSGAFGWEKFSENPVLSGTPGGWDGIHVQCTSFILEENYYKAWFAGNSGLGWRIGYATSPDGKQGWQKIDHPVIDIGSPDGWEVDTTDPLAIHDDEGYKMWYSSIRSWSWIAGQDRFRTRYATSPDGIEWYEGNWVLRGSPGAWDSGGIARGLSVLKTPSGYQMWYAGVNEAPMGSPEERWQIGYAVSPDGINWTKYPDNDHPQPVIQPTEPWELNSVSYPKVSYEDGAYHMWYAATASNLPIQIIYAISTDGIHWDKPAEENPVLTLGPPGSFDSTYIASPFVMRMGDTYKMWYDGYNGSRWQIGYAESPVPTQPLLQPIVLLPGLGASWNHESMILGIEQPQSEWYMTPGVRVYDGLVQTLLNAGYLTEGENRNLFIFNYNWTKPIESIATDLENYIESVVDPPEETQIDLIGHSMGGLVARTYVQNNPDHPVDQLLTLGSPLKGIPHLYYAWEGGDLNQTLAGWPVWQKIGLTLLAYLRRPAFATLAETIHSTVPSLQNLLPTFNYLKQNGGEKPIASMTERNDWLSGLNTSPPPHLLSALNNLVGLLPLNTPRWIQVGERNWLDSILDLWPDGKPTGDKELADGDNTILVESAQLAGANVINLPGLDHTDLVETTAGQEQIMILLALTPTEIVPAPEVNWESSLVFLLTSPANLLVLDSGGNPVGEGDNHLRIIPGATAGEYQVKVVGTGTGGYQLHIGQFTHAQNYWTTLEGKINPHEEHLYRVNFDPSTPQEDPVLDPDGQIHLLSARNKLFSLKDYLQSQGPQPPCKRTVLYSLNQTIRQLEKGEVENSLISLYLLRLQINSCQKAGKVSQDQARRLKNEILAIIKDLEKAYIITQENKGGQYPPKMLSQQIKLAKGYFEEMEKKLKVQESQGKATPDDGALYLAALEKIQKAKASSSYQAHINALGAKYLSLEGIFLFR